MVLKPFEHFCATIVVLTHAHLLAKVNMASIVCVNSGEVGAMLKPFERASAQLCFCIEHMINIRSTFVERMLVKCWNRLNGPLVSHAAVPRILTR